MPERTVSRRTVASARARVIPFLAALAALLLIPAVASPFLKKKNVFPFGCPPENTQQSSTFGLNVEGWSRVVKIRLYDPASGQFYDADDPIAGCPGSIGQIDGTSVTLLPSGKKHVEIDRTDTNPPGGDLGGQSTEVGMQVDFKSTADVTVKKEFVGPDTGAAAGYPYQWRIVVINRGPGPAKSVLLTDKFPRAFQVYPMAISPGGGEKDYTPPTPTRRATLKVEWDSIPPPDPEHPGRNRRVVIVGGEFNKTQDPSVKTVDNVAEVEVASGRTFDPKPGNNVAAKEVQVYR